MHRSQDDRDAGGATFAEDDVARSYYARSPYAPALYERLLQLTPGRDRALDLGCGPGKVATVLADHFAEVVALDPSSAMLELGRAADAGRHANIIWVRDRAETYASEVGFDLVTAAASIHWPDHAVLFPKLAGWTRLLAVIIGDCLFPPCGEAAWLGFLKPWLARMAEVTPRIRPYDPNRFAAEGLRHEAWMDIDGRETFQHAFRQSVEDFIVCQHSRATWNRATMGEALAAEFDRDLDTLMRPFSTGGMLELEIVSELTWGAPRATPK
ncbi:MAG TPA: class I SAM-dependent methyltransferase [Caulobacteraceae bacterium]|nr:class I SAM-dependent methyltransferase [Caulobacteraceae bacterium]